MLYMYRRNVRCTNTNKEAEIVMFTYAFSVCED